MTESAADLPEATKSRWQPLRAGLVDIFYYDYQEFWFRDGRLLLRGNNGTGKSKVLALTLPFLLDGRALPSRVEPDGDTQKRMEWNLLMGNRYNERTGYSWLEFGRQRQDGTTETFTIGCGMKAIKGRKLDTWFFTTDRRMVRDFSLLDGQSRTLGKERLKDVLGEHAVIDRAARYRQAVDETLFQLGPDRYEALVSLLIQLRQPQLSKRPDDKALSKALTEALPPPDAGILGEIADAFRNLEAERQELEGLRETGRAVDEFRRHYRQYARIAGRRRAASVRRNQSRYDKISADLNQSRAAHQDAQAQEEKILVRIEETKTSLQAARVREQTLQRSPEMRDAHSLRQAEQTAREKEDAAAAAEHEAQEIAREVDRRQARAETEALAVERTNTDVTARNSRLAELATKLGVESEHQRLNAPLQLPHGGATAAGSDPRIDAAETGAKKLCQRRDEQVGHVKRLNQALEQATGHHQRAHERWQEASNRLERLVEEQQEAETAADEAGRALVEAFVHYCHGLKVLQISEPDGVAESLREWTASLEGANPATQALASSFETASHRLAGENAQTTHRAKTQQEVLDELHRERARLEAGEQRQPPPPHTRPEGVRQHRAGSPLWRLIEFQDDTPAEQRAMVEAALESSGLLDAWVMPDGRLLDSGTWDVVFTPGPPAPRGLGHLLKPAVDRSDPLANTVTDQVLNDLLAAVGWGQSEHPSWIDGSGRWRLGPLHGQWVKSDAEYVGHGAREAARQRRLEALAVEIADAETVLQELKQRLDELAERKRLLDAEWRAAPDDEPMRRAHQQVAAQIEQKQAQQATVDKEAHVLAEAQAHVAREREARDLAAQDLDLPAAPTELARLESILYDYRAESHGFWPSLRLHWGALDACRQARQALAHEQRRLEGKARRVSEAQRLARESAAHRDTLRETLGDAVAVVERKLAQATEEIQRLEATAERLHDDRVEIAGQISAAATSVASHTEAQLEVSQSRREAAGRLAQFAGLGLLDAALPEHALELREGAWSIDHALHVARTVEKNLHQVDDSDKAWQNHQRQLHERISELQSALSRHGHEAAAEQHDDLIAVHVVFQSQRCNTETLAQRIAENIRERGQLLDAKEQELLEEHLVNELASHLQTMIQEAELTVRAMNDELERRPTSTGMKLRLKWRPLADGETWLDHTAPDGLNVARSQLLRQTADVWSLEDRKAVGVFLKKQIDDARLAEESGALHEVMAQALDYRYWHRFVVERWQEGDWRPAYGPASGGERALVVTIPLFAAASSHYTSAHLHAPRLVLLDEAFAGVDDDSRAKSLGLLAQFDMDVVMTSEREWSCYAEVPGVAIAQLTRREGVDAVHVAHWWWDGKRRRRAEEQIPDLEILEAVGQTR